MSSHYIRRFFFLTLSSISLGSIAVTKVGRHGQLPLSPVMFFNFFPHVYPDPLDPRLKSYLQVNSIRVSVTSVPGNEWALVISPSLRTEKESVSVALRISHFTSGFTLYSWRSRVYAHLDLLTAKPSRIHSPSPSLISSWSQKLKEITPQMHFLDLDVFFMKRDCVVRVIWRGVWGRLRDWSGSRRLT